MKIAIMGSGGIGGFYGGRLAKGGEEVTFIARGRHLNALRQNGLLVESPTVGNFELPTVQATDDPASVGVVDLVLMTVKTYDLDEASQAIAPMIGENTVVIPLLIRIGPLGRPVRDGMGRCRNLLSPLPTDGGDAFLRDVSKRDQATRHTGNGLPLADWIAWSEVRDARLSRAGLDAILALWPKRKRGCVTRHTGTPLIPLDADPGEVRNRIDE